MPITWGLGHGHRYGTGLDDFAVVRARLVPGGPARPAARRRAQQADEVHLPDAGRVRQWPSHVQARALDVPNDLALVRLDWGPAPYVCPVLDLYQYQGQPKHLIAVGYDELKIPAVQRECHYVRKEACWTVTKESMFHGSSGCSLQSDDGYLCGVYTGYPSDHMPRELEAAVQKAERRRAMLTKGGRPLSQQEQAEYDAVQAQYKRYVLSSRQGLWVQHSLIVKFIRGAGHGELLVRLNQNGPGPAPAHPRPAPPPADPFAGSPRPGPAAPVARRGSPACPT